MDICFHLDAGGKTVPIGGSVELSWLMRLNPTFYWQIKFFPLGEPAIQKGNMRVIE